jgi:hypothetical protein
LNPAVLESLKKVVGSQARLPNNRELMRWSQKWNLNAEWTLDWAAQTVNWQRTWVNRTWDRFYHPAWTLASRFERKPPSLNEVIQSRVGKVDFGSWIGNMNTRSEARKDAVRAFTAILDDALKEIAAAAIRAGLFESRIRRSRGTYKRTAAPIRDENEAFIWLAGFQTLGWSKNRIADAVGVERTTVGMSINALAAELNLTVRDELSYDKRQSAEIIRAEIEKLRKELWASEWLLNQDPTATSSSEVLKIPDR